LIELVNNQLAVNIKSKFFFKEKNQTEMLQKRKIIKKTKRTGSLTHPFLIKLTNLTKPKLMKINVAQR
jgi:hypothetical protein